MKIPTFNQLTYSLVEAKNKSFRGNFYEPQLVKVLKNGQIFLFTLSQHVQWTGTRIIKCCLFAIYLQTFENGMFLAESFCWDDFLFKN